MSEELEKALAEIAKENPIKIVISAPVQGLYKKINIQYKETENKSGYQVEKFTEKQAFHENISAEQLAQKLKELCINFKQINAFCVACQMEVRCSKKGKVSLRRIALQAPIQATQAHNKEKNYLLKEGTVIPPLVDLGIFTKEGKVVKSMYDKYRQINRFIELVDDSIRDKNLTTLNIIDFGCGKSYLTFILYYYFTQIRHIHVDMLGLDLKADVIEKCNAVAKQYGYEHLQFKLGDINGYQHDKPVDMVITLHACDTATDYALYNAINWGAKMIFSVPCCQHEANAQIKTTELGLLTKYGIVKERTAALITDAIRGSLLEYSGYKTQLLEFVDMESSPKNILIRAEKRMLSRAQKQKALAEVRQTMAAFQLEPTLYRLLIKEDN
ncbi:MAG: SAM-dependent methyltransferase [Oscillospiraceae bacterium]|nr:SAM-dependent methyltransferase [Oscillospiraceae bacterium]